MTTAQLLAEKIMAVRIRIETINELVSLGFGHIGGSMSIADLLGVLYGGVLNIDPSDPNWKDRDYFICSKGHAGPSVYAALALRGFFPMELLKTLNICDTTLPSHVDRLLTPGIDMTCGSLGQGLSVAAGIALSNRIDKRTNYTYCVLGDGELGEGQIWEAVMTAASYALSNLIAFVDHNGRQVNTPKDQVRHYTNIAERFQSFGWDAVTIDGHDISAIHNAIDHAKTITDRPSVIVLETIKGYGCRYAQEKIWNHSIPMPPEDQIDSLEKLNAELKALMESEENA